MATTLSPADARAAIDAGARLIDIRDPEEHARERIAGAVSIPLGQIDGLSSADSPVIFHCKSGMRTASNTALLERAAKGAPVHLLEGGIDGWRRAGHPTVVDRSRPIEVIRQVHITAGSLVLAGVLLGIFVSPPFLLLSGFVGAGLIFSGVTGWCGMAMLLGAMPWNRRAAA